MKRFINLGLVLFLTNWCLAVPVKQNILNGKVHIIPEFGIVTSTLLGVKSISEPGLMGGVGIRVGKTKHFYTGLYVRTVRFSAKITPNGLATPDLNLIHSAYLAIPLMYGRTFVDMPFFKMRYFAGGLVMLQQGAISGGFTRNDLNYALYGARAGGGINVGKIELNASVDAGVNKMFEKNIKGRFLGANLTLGYRF